MENFENRIPLDNVKNNMALVTSELQKIIVGQEKMINLLLISLLADGHVLIEGFPGLAKTITAKLLAASIDCEFKRLQFTPDMMPSDILGTSIFNFKTSEFETKKGPVFTNFLLIDEINRSPAKTQAALFEVMEERQVTLDGTTYKVPLPNMIIATQNPIDMEGTYRLPEAQMDRFLFKIKIDYPNAEEETQILKMQHKIGSGSKLEQINKVLSKDSIIQFQGLTKQVQVEEHLFDFISKIVQKTRKHKDIMVGASPRASIAMLESSKANAILNGRDFITPEDIIYVCEAVLNHRIILTPEKEMEGKTPEMVIQQIIRTVDVPR